MLKQCSLVILVCCAVFNGVVSPLRAPGDKKTSPVVQKIVSKVFEAGLYGSLAYWLLRTYGVLSATNHIKKILDLKKIIQRSHLDLKHKTHLLDVVQAHVHETSSDAVSRLAYWVSTCSKMPSKTQAFNDDSALVQRELDARIFGLEHAKQAVLNVLTAYKHELKGVGQAICLVGPPGVGKTSFAFAVAHVLGAPCKAVSLAGMTDPEIFFRGSNRTYVGSRPGFFVQSLIDAGRLNSVFVLDELDKATENDQRGNVYTLLHQALDPLQNHAFTDYFVEMPVDLSHAFFIITANSLEKIPESLKNRMTIITLPAYTHDQLKAIAVRYIWPKLTKGLAFDLAAQRDLFITRALQKKHQKTDSGVRELERALSEQIAEHLRVKQRI